MRRLVLSLVVAIATNAGVATALAHAFLVQAAPPVGGAVSAAPKEVRLTFSEPIEPRFSGIEVAAGDGHPISTGAASTDPADDKALVLPLPPLAPGRYRVRWHVVSVDTHRTEGEFGFEVTP
jgi:hypothetical protein